MPPKKKAASGAGGGGGGGGNWQKDEEDIQAIIVADSFDRKFTPLTYEVPRALLPLGNKVLIDYTIEYLLEEGVQEIIVFCCSLGEKIKEYVNKKWINTAKKCNIHCVMSSTSDCISLGDALREIDREGLIRSDFILVPGDLLSNAKLSSIMKEHKAKRKKEKNLVMTMLHRVLKPGHFSRCPEDDQIVAVEQDTNRLLHYQKSKSQKKFSFPTSILTSRKEVQIRYDLSNCHVSICSPQVAPLFTDNFDYQNLDDLIKGILINEEILGDQVHVCVVNGYSSRINDLHIYNAVSMDLLNRWIHPLVPESSSCAYRRNNIYVEDTVRIEKNCTFKENTMIGKNTCIGEGAVISNSIIGSNCKIGKNVQIENSYIWDNVTIEEDVSLTQTLVCSNCTLKRSSTAIDSIISFGVCVGSNVTLPPNVRLSLLHQESFEEQFDNMNIGDNTDTNTDQGTNIVGDDGKGFVWMQHSEEEDVLPSLTGNDYESSEEESSDDDDDDDESLPPTPPVETTNLYQFYVEVLENLRCGIIENIATDNIALEINASKFKFNISIQELCQTVIKAVLELAVKDATHPTQEVVKELEKVSTSLQKLLLKYYNSADTQLYAITAAEEYFASNLSLSGLFASLLHKLYDKDVLDETVILKWFKNAPVADDFSLQDNYNTLRENQTLVKLINWLEEADEEDSDEDDSE